MKDVIVIGKILKQVKNCGCGITKEGLCPECKTEATDVVILTSVESLAYGHYQADEDNFYHMEEVK